MVMQRSIKAFALAGTLALALAGGAQARDRLSEKNCPTGQIENRITAICEGHFAGSFMFVSPADGDNWQGHHNWQNRFERINAKLSAGLLAQEVCAESWPGQGLLEAARECVHSWRQSPGHWDAVKTQHPVFGYDMQRGANGVWYATGIFGRQH